MVQPPPAPSTLQYTLTPYSLTQSQSTPAAEECLELACFIVMIKPRSKQGKRHCSSCKVFSWETNSLFLLCPFPLGERKQAPFSLGYCQAGEFQYLAAHYGSCQGAEAPGGDNWRDPLCNQLRQSNRAKKPIFKSLFWVPPQIISCNPHKLPKATQQTKEIQNPSQVTSNSRTPWAVNPLCGRVVLA